MTGRRLPDWLRTSIPFSNTMAKVESLIRENGLNTVCVHAKCPNRAECYGRGTLTFMILGNTCSRNCRYCNVTPGKPQRLDPDEPVKIGRAVSALGLSYAVVTSVTRDDLPDGGAAHFAETIQQIKTCSPYTKTEVLVPDFRNTIKSLQCIVDADPEVIGHNIETVFRLFPEVRPQADYHRSLEVLSWFAKNSTAVIKSGLMAGLGESDEEIASTLRDLHNNGVRALTIGQYLSPSPEHAAVQKYYTPEEFASLEAIARSIGFSHVESGPLVRSSYYAERTLCS
ncbi:MAG: lipoyl synthase [Spirochaetales bacterium]|nr:lipoyl synthase [Spirochaetales bacterium]